MHTVPFHIFKDEIAKHLISEGQYDLDWFQGQTSRVMLMHNVGETLDGAKAMMLAFARGRHRPLTLRQIAEKYGRVVKVRD
jgi:hypothetical protein